MDSSSHNGEVIPNFHPATSGCGAAAETSTSASSSSSPSSFNVVIADAGADESASIKLGLSQLPAGVTVELYQCPICRLNGGGRETLFAVEGKLTTHLNAHVDAGDVARHHHLEDAGLQQKQQQKQPCQRPCLDDTGERILCDRWFMVQLFSNETGYGKLKWRARQQTTTTTTKMTSSASSSSTSNSIVTDNNASPSKSTFSVTIPVVNPVVVASQQNVDASTGATSSSPKQAHRLQSTEQQQQPTSANDDINDQEKNISLDWPHPDSADHAESLWNDELSQLEKKVVVVVTFRVLRCGIASLYKRFCPSIRRSVTPLRKNTDYRKHMQILIDHSEALLYVLLYVLYS